MAQAIKEALSQVKKIAFVSLLADNWIEEEDELFSQVVEIQGTTKNSSIVINPNIEQLKIFKNKDITFVVENNNNIITVYCLGQKPNNDYTVQVSIVEVEVYE